MDFNRGTECSELARAGVGSSQIAEAGLAWFGSEKKKKKKTDLGLALAQTRFDFFN